MKKTVVSSTEVTRSRPDLDREKVCLGGDLADVLKKARMSTHEARAWHRDLQAARKMLKAPRTFHR
ncbi:MAG: hypothetical protein WB781_11190 [Candidatus Sulfotelmatobacter sp.]